MSKAFSVEKAEVECAVLYGGAVELASDVDVHVSGTVSGRVVVCAGIEVATFYDLVAAVV